LVILARAGELCCAPATTATTLAQPSSPWTSYRDRSVERTLWKPSRDRFSMTTARGVLQLQAAASGHIDRSVCTATNWWRTCRMQSPLLTSSRWIHSWEVERNIDNTSSLSPRLRRTCTLKMTRLVICIAFSTTHLLVIRPDSRCAYIVLITVMPIICASSRFKTLGFCLQSMFYWADRGMVDLGLDLFLKTTWKSLSMKLKSLALTGT